MSPAPTGPGPAPRRAVTGRALLLGGVVVFLLIVLASPTSRWFASRSAAHASAVQLQHDQQQLRAVTHQLALWNDPGYVQQQARDRLQYAMPGDTTYVTVDHGQRNDIQRSTHTGAAAQAGGAWTERLWSSVQRASQG